jgi:zinc transporter 9
LTLVSADSKQLELKAVNTAVLANTVILSAKLCGWALSGSGALLAEAIHSVCDIANQLLLKAGVQQSRRAPTRQHPYGFHREKYIYALMSAVCVFCIGSGASVVYGIQSMIDPPDLEHMEYSLAILCLSGAIEMGSLMVAYRVLQKGASNTGLSLWKYLKRGRNNVLF